MKKYLYTAVLLFACLFHQAQTSQENAKAFYQEAIKAFDNKNPLIALDYCQKVISELQTTNARVEILKIKSYYQLGQYDNVKKIISKFTDLPSTVELKNEALEYLVKIEKFEKKEKEKFLSAQRTAQEERLQKEQKIGADKLKKEQEEANSYTDAMTGNISKIRQFLIDYPKHKGRQIAINLLDTKEEEAYNNALSKNSIPDYENYLTTFYDGKHKAAIGTELQKEKERLAFEQVLQVKSVVECANYLHHFLDGKNKEEVLTIYENALITEGQEAMKVSQYQLAENMYKQYIDTFPEGNYIKIAHQNYAKAQKKIKHNETISTREDKLYAMLNYATNESVGLEFGKVNVTYIPSLYLILNSGFTFPVPSQDPLELGSPEDYIGEGILKPSFIYGSLGLNMKITYPLWIYAGAGVRYQIYMDNNSDSYMITGEKDWQVFPEVGLKTTLGGKVWLKAGVLLFKDKPAFQFGIGF